MQKIYLASTSPRRKMLLKNAGIDFEICEVNYDEDMTLDMPPTELAKFLSRGKAESALLTIDEGIIIAADTFIVFDGKIMGKPLIEKIAKETLRAISSKVLDVVTGLTVVDASSGKVISEAVVTKVYMKAMDNEEIDAYVATGEPLDKAGAFGIQGKGIFLVEKIEGGHSNAVGLPMFELGKILKDFGIKIL